MTRTHIQRIENKNPIRVTIMNSEISVIFSIIIGVLLVGPWSRELLDTIRGYRWDSHNKCIMESPNEAGDGVDYCRIPADCSVCSGVNQIDELHISNISIQNFVEKYSYTGRPLVVRNASLQWRAMTDLDYYWLKEQYLRDPKVMDLNEDCWFNRYKTKEFKTLADVFKLPDNRVQMKSGRSWYVGWEVCHEQVLQELLKLYERPAFIHPESTQSNSWIFIGTPGKGAYKHVDEVDMAFWQAQINGIKKWKLSPPPECYWTCGSKTLETILYPGDILVVKTSFWFHSTEILGNQLSLVVNSKFDEYVL